MHASPRGLALLVALCASTGSLARAQDALPPPPARYFNDYAGVVPAAEADRLNEKLRRFDEETSTQVVVAVFPKLESLSLEDFTFRTAESWRVGREGLHNGAVLFVFVDDRQMRIEVGYGLEGALPDVLAFRILEDRVKPHFRSGDYAGGLEAGIDGILAATRGEYTAPPRREAQGPSPVILILIVLAVLVFIVLAARSQGPPGGRTYGRQGWRRDRSHWGGTTWTGGFGGGLSGGGGCGGVGGFGGFSGGGGSFGGGGASSSW